MEVLCTSKNNGKLAFGPNEYKFADELNEDYSIVVSIGVKRKSKYKSKLNDDIVKYHIDIGDGDCFVKPMSETKLRNLTEKLAKCVMDGQNVYIHGFKTAAYIACIVWFWLKLDPKFDPALELKKRGLFQYLQAKEQRIHIKKLCGQSDKKWDGRITQTMFWKRLIIENKK